MSLNLKICLSACLLFLPYVTGAFFPDSWWAVHYAAFLPFPWNYISILIPVGLLLVPLDKITPISGKDPNTYIFPAPILMVLLLVMVTQIQNKEAPRSLLTASLAFALVTIPVFVVNTSRNHLS